MSKKLKKAKKVRRGIVRTLNVEPVLKHAEHQMLQGDFAGAILTCKPLLDFVPKQSPKRADVLAPVGLAHAMLQHFEESYDIFTEAVALVPTSAEVWYNLGLACDFTTRYGQEIYAYERASENKIKSKRVQVGKQQPRHRFFLNPYKDSRFTECPRCGNKTRPRKFCLVIHIHPSYPMLLDKVSRYCYHCDLIIVHQDQLEARLTAFFKKYKPEVISNDYLVMGTLDRAELQHDTQNGLPVPEMLDHLHDFAEVLSFERRKV